MHRGKKIRKSKSWNNTWSLFYLSARCPRQTPLNWRVVDADGYITKSVSTFSLRNKYSYSNEINIDLRVKRYISIHRKINHSDDHSSKIEATKWAPILRTRTRFMCVITTLMSATVSLLSDCFHIWYKLSFLQYFE